MFFRLLALVCLLTGTTLAWAQRAMRLPDGVSLNGGTVTISPYTTATVSVYTSSSVATGTSTVVCPANTNRKAFCLWNNGANSGYDTFGPYSASAGPTTIHASFTSLCYFGPVVYTGVVSAIRNSGSGTYTCHELQ